MLLLEFKDPEMERRIVDWVMSGAYPSAADVITAALRLLEQQERARAFGRREVDVRATPPEPKVDPRESLDAEQFFREIPSLHPQGRPEQDVSK